MRWPWSDPEAEYVNVEESSRRRLLQEAEYQQGIDAECRIGRVTVNGMDLKRLRLVYIKRGADA